MNGDFWKRKLLAFLHDPPNKPYSIREHWEIAKDLICDAHLSEELANRRMNKAADRMAACADRIVFPKPSKLIAKWEDAQLFRHPLGGGKFQIRQPMASEELAEKKVSEAQLRLGLDSLGDDFRKRFYFHWRLWRQYCAQADPHLVMLPADTRIPDHTIWTHCSLVSALQACAMDATGARDTTLKPAFLLFQIGPVQEFIEQARTTRDCWSGSYLLSWLICRGMKALADREGPDCVLFPSLYGQPLFDFLNRDLLDENTWDELKATDQQILTPSLPNRFLAVVHAERAGDLAAHVKGAIQDELRDRIGPSCLAWLAEKEHTLEDKGAIDRWNQQLDQFLQFYWQVWEWQDIESAMAMFDKIPAGKHAEGGRLAPAESLREALKAATEGIPEEHCDARNYQHKATQNSGNGRWTSEIIADGDTGRPVIDNPAFAWAAHYALAEFYLAARKNTRDFAPWADRNPQHGSSSEDTRKGSVKDMFSGKEETIGSEDWQKGLANIEDAFLFKENERLGAMSIIKRIWHRAYLEEKFGLSRRWTRFDSVPAIAAGAWVEQLNTQIGKGDLRSLLFHPETGFAPSASRAKHLFPGIHDLAKCSKEEWFDKTDGAAFHLVEWDRAIRKAKKDSEVTQDSISNLRNARAALKEIQKSAIGKPMPYVAILAMDGDSMGQWVSGAKTPKLSEQLAELAREYFEEHEQLRGILDAPRHVSPSYHLQFSEALGNFSVYLAGPIVDYYGGRLIYAGGDDVLAMLPAETVFDCAVALRMAFRGNPLLHGYFPGVLQEENEEGMALDWGFVALDGRWKEWTRFEKNHLPLGYPLIVPGQNADISAGIAIGHMHTPLQTLIAAARDAERNAKDEDRYNKCAFAVNLAKRSGELLQWGAKWDEKALDLLEKVQAGLAEKFLSEKFPYALQGVLRPYALQPGARAQTEGVSLQLGSTDWPVLEIVRREFEHALTQHALKRPGDETFRKELSEMMNKFLETCVSRHRTLDDFLGPLMTASFITKGGE